MAIWLCFIKSEKTIELIYYEVHNGKGFYDGMRFWNYDEGIAVGDPIENVFSIITTRDGGKIWTKDQAINLQALSSGEAAFAASNTNIVINKNETWIVSGGTNARIFYSTGKGKNWTVLPNINHSGKHNDRNFAVDFYDNINCFIAGNYDDLKLNFGDKVITPNGGKIGA